MQPDSEFSRNVCSSCQSEGAGAGICMQILPASERRDNIRAAAVVAGDLENFAA